MFPSSPWLCLSTYLGLLLCPTVNFYSFLLIGPEHVLVGLVSAILHFLFSLWMNLEGFWDWTYVRTRFFRFGEMSLAPEWRWLYLHLADQRARLHVEGGSLSACAAPGFWPEMLQQPSRWCTRTGGLHWLQCRQILNVATLLISLLITPPLAFCVCFLWTQGYFGSLLPPVSAALAMVFFTVVSSTPLYLTRSAFHLLGIVDKFLLSNLVMDSLFLYPF